MATKEPQPHNHEETPILPNVPIQQPKRHFHKKHPKKPIKKGRYRVVGPSKNLKYKDVQRAVPNLNQLLKEENKQYFMNRHQIEQLDPETHLDGMSNDDLAEIMHDHFLPVDSEDFMNIGETVKTQPSQILNPETVEQLQEIVKKANSSNTRIRAVGNAHSWTPVFPGKQQLLSFMF